MSASINLRDSLLAALSKLPGVREFHIHVLVSAPRKSSSLYPYAKPRPKAYLHDIVVLCSEQENPDAPRVLVTAIEANVFHIPATSSAVLYVSKVDSTGQSKGKAPTATLVRALLAYYADPATRPVDAEYLWVQLFARAQGQYLFPNSAEFSGKQPLTDAKLCSWWKRVLTQTIADVEARAADKAKAKAFYILPGYDQPEAEDLIRVASATAAPLKTGITWFYTHPYSQEGVPLPCPRDADGENLGTYIPWFDDDPKSRFIDEIALITTTTEGIKSPSKKRARTESHSDVSSSKRPESDKSTRSEKEDKPMGELKKVSVDEFWERMSFRQECVAGAVTGFFSVIFSPASTGNPKGGAARSTVSPLAPQPGQVAPQIIKRVMTSLLTGVEFSTREKAVRSTETVESAIKGLCEGMASAPVSTQPALVKNHSGRKTPERESTPPPALLAPPSTPPRRTGKAAVAEVSPNPFPDPVTSLDTYLSYIYGSAAVSMPVADEGSKPAVAVAPVTVLTARRKKKRGD
ncbi:hypothetical protein EST38_g1442 [Candolleomyces aberdarensis]|uniref:histone acetyltransferase n=1 Tax=Candolleomyces aberdarensis TaxID=2316362 RepID=A0A4Q2DW48_9AGAR|nr:hypothetical protein EST38_g1442 [Candolleomyces aberdarensis]